MSVLAFLVVVGLLVLARTVATRRAELLVFLRRPVYRLETFDEVVFGVPYGRLPESLSWVLAAIGLLLVGGIGALGLGLGLFAFVRTAPQMVIPAMVSAYAAWVGWQGLGSQVGRRPMVRRLRLRQPHLQVDDVDLGMDFEPDDIEAAPLERRSRTVDWSDIRAIDIDDVGRLVLAVHGQDDLVFGPLPDDEALEIAERIERRIGLEDGEDGAVIDLARARLRALTERADRREPPPGSD